MAKVAAVKRTKTDRAIVRVAFFMILEQLLSDFFLRDAV
jgi:hypothetical protein